MEKVFEVYIKTTPERLWEAITDPEIRAMYNFGARQTPEWTPGSRYQMGAPGAPELLGGGGNLEVDPPRRLRSVRRLTADGSDSASDSAPVRCISSTNASWTRDQTAGTAGFGVASRSSVSNAHLVVTPGEVVKPGGVLPAAVRHRSLALLQPLRNLAC